MRTVTIQPERDEAVSPELVLVDPELGQLARSRLPQAAGWSPSPRGTLSRPAPIAAAKSWSPPSSPRAAAPRRTLTAAMGAVGVFATTIPALLLGAVIVGMVASEVRAPLVNEPAPLVSSPAVRPPATRLAPPKTEIPSRRPVPSPRASSSARTPTQTPPNPTPRPKARAAPERAKAAAPAKPPPVSRAVPKIPAKAPAKAPAVEPAKTSKAPPVVRAKTPKAPVIAPAGAPGSWIPSKAEVEARTLVLLQERVALWVPPELLDRKTNLLVNNVQAVCRQVARTPRFDCRLEVGGSRGGWLLTAVAAKNGSVKLTWRGRAPAR